MSLVSVKDYPVYKKYWYILDFRNLLKVKLLPHYYLNPKSAKRSIEQNLRPLKRKYFRVMKGEDVKDFVLTYAMGMGLGRFSKYRYSIWDVTDKQRRKNHRTQTRRRLRKIGLLTVVRPKVSIRSKPQTIKEIPNNRRIVKKPLAIVIQIERKPDKYYYVVHKRLISQKRGKLFKITGIRFNNKTGEIKKYTLHTLRTDLLIPYLITDLEQFVYEKIQDKSQTADYFRQWGFRYNELA